MNANGKSRNQTAGPGVFVAMNLSAEAKTMVQRVDLLNRLGEATTLLCSFFWSDDFGLRCSVPHWLNELEATGIATPGGKVYPTEGRRFFDALQVLVLSVVEITAPRAVPASEVCPG